MPKLSLTLLGSFQASLDGEAVSGFQSDKARALLVYLAAESSRPHTRLHLAGLLWPEWPESDARRNLRHALANLRRILNDSSANQPFLLTSHRTIQFNPESNHHLDVAEFLRAATLTSDEVTPDSVQSWEKAAALYQGPFLQGFFLNDCSAFEEWV